MNPAAPFLRLSLSALLTRTFINILIFVAGAEQNCVDSLAFETGIPKSIIQRYASLLSEHRRIILSGPTGTGKSHLAQHLAQHLISRFAPASSMTHLPTHPSVLFIFGVVLSTFRSSLPISDHNITMFDCEHKSSEELRSYLCSIQEKCEADDIDSLPAVIILDNLHHVSSLGDVFSGFLSHKAAKWLVLSLFNGFRISVHFDLRQKIYYLNVCLWT